MLFAPSDSTFGTPSTKLSFKADAPMKKKIQLKLTDYHNLAFYIQSTQFKPLYA